jgi:SAM-dependent methyltransferase
VTEREQWVRESRFGIWFQGTEIWNRYVLYEAIGELDALIGPPRRRFGTILDAGCGHGAALRELEQRFRAHRIVAVDRDPEMVERAREVSRGCSCSVEVRIGDVAKLDLPDASLDLVFCHQTLHHVSDPVAVLHEFRRVLRPGGLLLMAESCRPFIRLLRVRALFRHSMEVQKSASEYLQLLRDVGFAFGSESASTGYPWWSRPDLGILEWLGRPVPANREPTLVHVAALR